MVVYASKHYNYNYLNLSLLFFELVQVREEALLQCGLDTTTVQTVIYQFSLQILRFHFLYPDMLEGRRAPTVASLLLAFQFGPDSAAA